MLPAWQHARRKRRGSGRAASYKLVNQASSAGVWRRGSRERQAARAHFLYAMPAACALSGPAGCPACLDYATHYATRSYSPPVPLCCIPSPPSPPLGSWARPGCTGCSPGRTPAPNPRATPTEYVERTEDGGRFQFSVLSTTPAVQLPVQLPDRPKKWHHRIPYVLGWADFSVVVFGAADGAAGRTSVSPPIQHGTSRISVYSSSLVVGG
jgi:hypothetical protein